ncbi:amphi-Trp domain-containing protein [Rhodococcus pyridinivorans]|uniref:amphi-Trp domain-containing protein n=3 Tax=Nocardiaceae TaxID=85025 RepID=UPI000AAF1F39|nr:MULTISPECIES: amphi-Trp domain-containing protein [Rhodococcus]UVT25505.1 amphi-Trp domain-containing protein [Rhodococcus pyridinivorans]
MPKLEIKQKAELSRKQASERLIALGRALATGSEVELDSGGDTISLVVADRLEWELEIEVDGDQVEIEVEFS